MSMWATPPAATRCTFPVAMTSTWMSARPRALRALMTPPAATVVWVNESSRIYHFAGTRDYGHTKRGAYMCEADAQAAGNRAAKNERHP